MPRASCASTTIGWVSDFRPMSSGSGDARLRQLAHTEFSDVSSARATRVRAKKHRCGDEHRGGRSRNALISKGRPLPNLVYFPAYKKLPSLPIETSGNKTRYQSRQFCSRRTDGHRPRNRYIARTEVQPALHRNGLRGAAVQFCVFRLKKNWINFEIKSADRRCRFKN